MNEFYAGIIACAAIVGGMCSLIYWFFCVFEKRVESKFDSLSNDVHRIANELREERLSRDNMYKFVMNHIKPK